MAKAKAQTKAQTKAKKSKGSGRGTQGAKAEKTEGLSAETVLNVASEITSGKTSLKSLFAGRSKKEAAMLAGGAIAMLGLLSTKQGRGLLKVAVSVATPIVAGLAKKKAESVANA